MREFISLSGELAEGVTPTANRGQIHKFELDGDFFVVDPASGAVHIADAQAFELLDKKALVATFEKYEGLEGGCYKELRDLYKAGLLFSEDDCREYAETSIDSPLKALCLHVSHDCNLRCKYCFAEDAVRDRTTMTPEVAIAAIDFLVANSGDRIDLEADFFGGEPLMAWDTVVAAVDYARSNESKWGKSFRFTITTNGLLLDSDKIEYINREMTNCVLSLDGRREVNDRMRPCLNGKGSFDAVLPKFRELLESRTKPDFTDCYIRGTFTAHNLDFVQDVIELTRLGFRNISLEPVTCYSEADYAIRPEHMPAIFAEYEKLYRLIKSGELDVNFFHFNVDLSGGPCVIRRLRGCGAGNEYLAIAPDGSAYPCHRFVKPTASRQSREHLGSSSAFVGDSKWKIDNVGTVNVSQGGGLCPPCGGQAVLTAFDRSVYIKSYFAQTHIYSKSDCPDCWARFYCSGGCNATSHECFGDCRKTDSQSVDCLMMKKRLECGIALGALKS